MSANQAQRDQWNAPSQRESWPRRERITTMITEPLLQQLALRPGEHVLDVGCGGGLAAMTAAQAVGSQGYVVGFDLSEPLVDLATERAREAGIGNVRFVAGDAQTDDIAGGPFDAAMSQFGVMFFADPVAAFTNIRRHLKPRARLVFACWQPAKENRWFPGLVLAKYAPAPPAPPDAGASPAPGPFAFGDPQYVHDILGGAGFGVIRHKLMELEGVVAEESFLDRDLLSPLRLDEARQAHAWADLRALAESMRGADGMLHLRLAPQLFEAVNGA